MMSLLFLILLGFIQGMTEFLPVSSSGHLAVAQNYFGFGVKNDLLIEIVAHFGSLLSILFFYRRQVFQVSDLSFGRDQIRKLLPLLVSVLPAGFVGFFFQDKLIPFFSNMNVVAFGFLITSALLISLKYLQQTNPAQSGHDWPDSRRALLIGFSQAAALFPGISRSGSTIVTGIWLGLKPRQAAFFSFCSVVPLILGATLKLGLKVLENQQIQGVSLISMGALLFSSFLFGWVGLWIVDRFLEKDKFFYFSFYLVPLALFLLLS